MSTAVKPIRCAIYTRKSTDENLDMDFNTLDAQREAAEAYIASQKHEGWTPLAERYDDGGFSGGTTDRPAFQRLMADVQEGRVDCIVVYKIDRLSRSLLDFAQIMEVLDRYKVSLVSVTQQFNTTNSMGRLTLNILLSFAQFEREIISERTRDKMAAARRKGKWTGGRQMLGYDCVSTPTGNRLAVNEPEAERVRAIFRMYLEKESMGEVVKTCRERGWMNKRYKNKRGEWTGGKPFVKSTLHRFLTNPIFLGKVVLRGEVYEGEHEAIVDEDLFGRVQGMIRRNTYSGSKFTRNKFHALLKGLVRCRACGCAMTHHFTSKGSRRYRYYVCVKAQKTGWRSCPAPSLPAIELENFVVAEIKGLGADARLIEENILKTEQRVQSQIDDLKARRKEVDARVRELTRQVGELSPRVGYDTKVSARMDQLQADLRDRQKESTRINENIVRLQKRLLDRDELIGAMESFDPMWDSLTPKEKARLVHLLVDRVEYDGEKEAITIAFHPTGIGALDEQTPNEQEDRLQ